MSYLLYCQLAITIRATVVDSQGKENVSCGPMQNVNKQSNLLKKKTKQIIEKVLGKKGLHYLVLKKSQLSHQQDESQWIFDYFKDQKSGQMIDVGAHRGETFYPYLRKGWHVLAFEPNPKNIQYIPEFKNLDLIEAAVADYTRDSQVFYESPESTGISSLNNFHASHSPLTNVSVVTLNDALKQRDIINIDYLKIDTEGYDLFCLKGLDFEKYLPKLVMVEFEDKKTQPLGYCYQDLGNFLLEKNYLVFLSEWFPVNQYGQRHRWRELKSYPCKLRDENGWGNFIAIVKEYANDFLKHTPLRS